MKLSRNQLKKLIKEELDYIDSLLGYKDKQEWSVDHEGILDLARNESPNSRLVAPIETIHQINAILLQFREELKSKYLRMIGKHKRRNEMDIPMVINTFKNLSNIIKAVDVFIDHNKRETKNHKCD